MLWQFLVLLTVHWFADFVLQTHWQASNKSKNNEALLQHVSSYTGVLWVTAPILFGVDHFVIVSVFVLVNGALHFATDFVTSRITSKLFLEQFETFDLVIPPPLNENFKMRTEPRLLMKKNFNPHWFFVVLGIDQLIHHLTLAGTIVLFFGGR